MPHLIIRVIGTKKNTNSESVIGFVESEKFDPDHLNDLINTVLTKSMETLKITNLSSLSLWHPEISISLTSGEDEIVRPSLHLSSATLQRLSEANASLDFDPYV